MKQMLANHEASVVSAITTSNDRLASVQTSMIEVRPVHAAQHDDDEVHDLERLMKGLEDEVAGLRSASTLLQDLLSMMKQARTEIGVDNRQNRPAAVSFGRENTYSGLQIGVSHAPINLGDIGFGNR